MWSNFELSAADEVTVNNIFCTSGIFKISANEEVQTHPKVQAVVQNKKMLITIDKSLVLLEDENVAECRCLSFEAFIECIAMSESGNLVICALSDGNIHGVNINGTPAFNVIINEDDIGDHNSFVSISQLDDSYFFVCSSGRIYKLSNVEERSESISCITENEIIVFSETLLTNVKLERITEKKYISNINSACLLPICGSFQTMTEILLNILCDESYYYFQIKGSDFKIALPESCGGFKKIWNLDNYILGLSNSGELFEICPYTKLLYKSDFAGGFLINDLVVLENSNENIELLILSKPNRIGKTAMKIIDFPSMKCTYDLVMAENSWLVNQPKSSVNVYYLRGISEESDIPQQIEMMIISEIHPAQRLKKLILRGHLEEAEEFAKQFNLSLQPIYECKASKMIVSLSSSKNNQQLGQKFIELLQLLESIESKEYLLNIQNIDIPDRLYMVQFLQFLLKKLSPKEHEQAVCEIHEQLRRLDTLKLVDPFDCNLEWQKFLYHNNLVKVCSELFKTDIQSACLIWARHTSSIVPLLDAKNVTIVMNAIPPNTKPIEIIQWLRHFVPSLLQFHPQFMSAVVDWSIQKTRSLQYSNLWPEIGLEFSNNILRIFSDITFMFVDSKRSYESNIEKLQLLVNALEDLAVLKTRYSLTITLDDYFKDTLEDTAFNLLQRVQFNNLQKLIKDFLYPIFMEKNLQPTSSIIKYITYLVLNRRCASFWQERAVALIELLPNEEDRLQCTLLVLNNAPVPWSDKLNPLFMYSTSSHPLAAEIRTKHELQIIKIIKIKYNWPVDTNDNPMMLIFRIMKMNLPDMLEDVQQLVKVLPEIRKNAYFYCVHQLTKRGDLDIAVKFIDNLDKKTKKETCEHLINILMDMLANGMEDEGNDLNFLELLNILNSKIYGEDKSLITDINRLYTLKFKFKITINDITLLSDKYYYLQKGISFIKKELKDYGPDLLKKVWNNVTALTTALEVDLLSGLIDLATQISNLQLSCAIAHLILNMVDVSPINSELIVEYVILMITQQMQTFMKSCDDLTDPLVFPLAYQLLSKAMIVSKKDYFEILNIIRWIRIGSNLYHTSNIDLFYNNVNLEKQILSDLVNNLDGRTDKSKTNKRESISIFENVGIEMDATSNGQYCNPQPLLKCICSAFKLILKSKENCDSLLNTLKNYLGSDLNVLSLNELRSEFVENIEILLKLKMHSDSYAVATQMMIYQKDNNLSFLPKKFFTLMIRNILIYSLSQKEPNFIECLTILFSDENPIICLNYLEEVLKHDIQMINLLSLTEMFYHYNKDFTKVAVVRENRLKYKYYKELSKLDPNLKIRNNLEFISISHFIRELGNKILNVKLIEKLSKDFNWDYQEVLAAQLITILNMQDLRFDIATDALGKEEILIRTSTEEIRSICQPYINETSNSDLLAAKLLEYIKGINFYFYELYLCIIEILIDINKLPKEMDLWRSILLFLKHQMTTKRKNRIGQMETDDWLKSQPEVGVLPKIAKYRFPFKLIVHQELRDTLGDEINVENCEKWFPLIKLHAALQNVTTMSEIMMEQEHFCMSAVKNSISEYKLQTDETEDEIWHLKPINNAFLQSILRLIKHMSTEWKILCILYFVANHAPDGADQVEAAYECWKYAIENEDVLMTSSKAKDTVVRIKRKYPIFKTQHLLHLYKLADESLFQLVENPKELISALYSHPSILCPQKPDINKVAAEIAELHKINLRSIQITLMQKWMAFSNDEVRFGIGEEIMCDDFTMVMAPNCLEAENNEAVIRAHYILSSWSTEKSIEFLISNMVSSEGSVSTAKQLKIFECVTRLIDDSSTFYNDIISQKDYIVFKCVNLLKQLGYNIQPSQFTEHDKVSFLKKLWQKYATNPTALHVMALICLGYDIDIPQIWDGILKQMVNLNMISQLSSLVDLLSTKTALLMTNGLALAWQSVIKAPFKNANRNRSTEQETNLCKALLLLQTCPVTLSLDLVEIAELCINIDRPHMAAVLIAFASSEVKEKLFEILSHYKNDNLKSDILELEEFGLITIISKYVLSELFS